METRLEKSAWPGTKPEFIDEAGRLVDSGLRAASGVLRCSHGIAIEIQPAHGVFGLVETGEVEVSPDRSEIIAKSKKAYSEGMSQLMQGLVPRISEAVDGLEQFGSIPARHSFLREIAEQHGVDLLAGSSLRWIPTLEQPGNLIHRSRAELKEYLVGQTSVVICSGISPGRAYDLAAQRLDPSELSRSLEILLPQNEFDPNFDLEKRLEVQEGSSRLRGNLNQILEKADYKKGQFLLLGILLDLVAEAWSVRRLSLEEQQWEIDVDYSKGYLWANLKRPNSGL